MKMKLGRFAVLASGITFAGTAFLPVGMPSAGASTISQTYSCSSPVGTLSASTTVSGTAALVTKTIKLSKVKFTIKNPSSLTIKADKIKINVPDPNKTSAPYKSGSAKVATTPAGWTAGHTTHGIFAEHAGTITLAGNATVSNAPLSAAYTDKGPAGTVISFHPGAISFSLTSPVSGPVSCTPESPVGTIASVTE